jgi:uncharacterized protein (TIGR03437 family)
VAATPSAAQPVPVIAENGVMNAASFIPPDFPGGALAPGGLISIFGANLGPAAGVQASGFPLPMQLGGTEVFVGDGLRCHLLYVSAQQINCQLPGTLDRDRIRLHVRTRDQDQIRESAPVEVPAAGANVGLFSQNGNGRGPAAALNFSAGPGPNYQNNGPEMPARHGQVVLLFGTGLGRTEPPDAGGQAANGLMRAVEEPEVFVGGFAAQVQYAGRAPGFAGLDQIQIVIPPNAPEGCAVPVMVRVRDRIRNRMQDSNVTTIAIHATQLRCQDGFEGMGSGSHGSVVLASGVGRLGNGQQGPAAPGNPGQGPGPGNPNAPGGPAAAMQNATGFDMHPGIPPQVFGPGPLSGMGLGAEVIAARFVRFGRPDVGIPPAAANACTVYYQGPGQNPDLFLGSAELMDAGELTLDTPGSSLKVPPTPVEGLGVLYAAPLPEPLGAGAYRIRGAGGADVGPFGPVNLQVPALVRVTNRLVNGTVILRSNPYPIVWTGGGGTDLVVIHGRAYMLGPGMNGPVADPGRFRSMAFLCSANASAGQFLIPAQVLQQLPSGQLSLTVTHMPSATGVSRFDAQGLTLGGAFRWLSTVTYPNLILGQ